MQKNTKIRQ